MVNQKIALVIDDDPSIVDAVKYILKEQLHYLVLSATDPEVAIDLAQTYAFDLLILDLHMPKLDGFQVLDIVRKKQPQIKVIIVTGFYEQYKEQYEKAKIDKIIEKPIEPPQFAKDILAIAGNVDLDLEEKTSDRIPSAKILIVDDENEVCEVFQEWIQDDEPNQYQIEVAHNMENGLVANNQFEPDFLFFDIKMPYGNGDEFLQRIKNGKYHKPKFFAVISAVTDQNVIEEFRASGCLYFIKPFRIEEILEFIRSKCLENGLCKSV